MPIYDGNDKIGSIYVNIPFYDETTSEVENQTVEIREIRLGSTPIFPDSVGQVNIRTFEILNNEGTPFTGAASGTSDTTLRYRVSGQPGAEFLVDAATVGISISSSQLELDSTGVYEQTFQVLTQSAGAGARQVGLRLLPLGSTGLEDDITTPLTITQSAGESLPTLNESAGYGWYPGATAATVTPPSGPGTSGASFSVTIPSGMFSPPSGWVVAQVQWSNSTSRSDSTYDGIFSTSEGIAAGETHLPDAFGVPQALSATSYQSNSYTLKDQHSSYTSYSSNGTVVYRHTSGEREGRAYTWRYTFE